MKKNNNKGFTLIELLAVVVIMGILSVVAVSAVNRIMENTRKDTFIDTVKQYTNGAKNMWAADNLECDLGSGKGKFLSSAVPNGTYYVKVNSASVGSNSVPQLLDDGGKSSWGKRDMKGYIIIDVTEIENEKTSTMTRQVNYYPVIVDGVHGVNLISASGSLSAANLKDNNLIKGEDLVRGKLTMSGAEYTLADEQVPKHKDGTSAAVLCYEV